MEFHELVKRQHTINERGIRVELIKLDVDPQAEDQWKVAVWIDDNPLHFLQTRTFLIAKRTQFELLEWARAHGDDLRNIAATQGWLFVQRAFIKPYSCDDEDRE
jgi:hypothetical protein